MVKIMVGIKINPHPEVTLNLCCCLLSLTASGDTHQSYSMYCLGMPRNRETFLFVLVSTESTVVLFMIAIQ